MIVEFKKIKENKFLSSLLLTSTFLLLFLLMFNININSVNAMSAVDIEFLKSLGIIDDEKAENAKQALGEEDPEEEEELGPSYEELLQSFLNAQEEEKNQPEPETTTTYTTNENFSTQCILLKENLVVGKTGNEVVVLQQFLREQGYFNYPTNTGYFGSLTKIAVIEFQLETGLISDRFQEGSGGVGPITRDQIKKMTCVENILINNFLQKVESENELESSDSKTFLENTSSLLLDNRRERIEFSNIVQGEEIIGNKNANMKLTSRMVKDDIYEGEREFKYEVEFNPSRQVSYFLFTVSCESFNANIVDNKKVKQCGDKHREMASTKGTASIRVKFSSVARQPQDVGVIVEAYDRQNRLIGFDETYGNLSPVRTRPLDPNDQFIRISDISRGEAYKIVQGIPLKANPPQSTLCSYYEQLDYMRFVMTASIGQEEPPNLPVCWPGNLSCGGGIPYTHCSIVDGPDSTELCDNGFYFYDGRCRPNREVGI